MIYTQGQNYGAGSPTPASVYDYQTAYIDFWLRFIGAGEVVSLTAADTWGDTAEASIAQACAEARALAASF